MSYTFNLLTSSNVIGDSLSAVNNNYLYLDDWISSIELSANNYWKPFVEYYRNFSIELKQNIKAGQENLSNWISMATTVETNSSKWLEPLMLFYTDVLSVEKQKENNFLNEITDWINEKFPVLNDYCPNGVCFLEYQEATVHILKRETSDYPEKYWASVYNPSNPYKNKRQSDSITRKLSDSTICNTTNTIASGPCSVTFSGSVNCNGGHFGCGGGSRSCTVSQTVDCFFPDGKKQNPRGISATINYNFYDQYESSQILRLKYAVSDCKWIFLSII
jgi:hypothetical protein